MGPRKYSLRSSLLLRAVPWLTRVGSGHISSKAPRDSDPTNPIGWCRSCVNKKARAAHRAQLDDTERTEEVDAVEDLEALCE